MHIIDTTSQHEWNGFVCLHSPTPFHQLWEWGALEEAAGEVVKRWRVMEGDMLRAQAQVWYHRMPGGFYYAYLPRGPLFSEGMTRETQQEIMGVLVQKVQQEFNPVFLLCEPYGAAPLNDFVQAPSRLPEFTLLIDLSKSEEELLNEMHPKWRYNIHLAERKGMEVRIDEEGTALPSFLKLLDETAKRGGFKAPPSKHFYQLFQTFKNDGAIKVVIMSAYYQNKVIAAHILLAAGDSVTYLHGASSNEYHRVMAPHLLQWHGIQWAHAHRFKWYDVWGIAPDGGVKEKEWAGITRFKMGFGGEVLHYPHAAAKVYRRLPYFFYSLVRGAGAD